MSLYSENVQLLFKIRHGLYEKRISDRNFEVLLLIDIIRKNVENCY